MLTNPDLLKKSIALYLEGNPMLRVAEITGITFHCLQRQLQKRGLSRSNKVNSRKYTFDETFFETIDTEEKAYWLGFMYADGYVSIGKYCNKFGMSLGIKDVCHLEKFKKALNATNPVNIYKVGKKSYNANTIYARLLVSSEKTVNDLIKQGVLPHKSLILAFPTKEQVPNELIRHFIRGYFEGDGGFSKTGQPNSFSICVLGTMEMLLKILLHFDCSSKKLYRRWKEKTNNSFYFKFGGMRQVKRIASYMYDDATVYLDRKHEIYKQIMAYQGRKFSND